MCCVSSSPLAATKTASQRDQFFLISAVSEMLLLSAAAALVVQAAAEEAATAAATAADEGLFVHMLPYIVLGLTVVIGTQVYRGSDTGVLPCKFLGLRVVYWTLKKAPEAEDDSNTSSSGSSTAAAAGTAAPLPPSSGNKKKTRKLQQQQQQLMGGGQAGTGLLQAGYIYPGLLALLEFTEDFDYVLRFMGIVLVNLAAALAFRWFLTPSLPHKSLSLLVTGYGYLFYTLYKVEWAHVIIGRDEKVYMSVAAVAGAVTAFSLLVWAGPAALAVNMSAATEEFTLRVAAVVRARFPQLPADELQPVTEAGPMGTVLALVGGALAGLLMAPGVRYGRLLQAFLEPPSWVQGLRPSTPDKLVVQAGFALQLLLLPLWVPSMVDVLRLPAASLPLLRGGSMLLAGLLQARAMPALLQAFMYNTPLHAHIATRNPAASAELTAKSVKRVAQVTLSQTSKVAVQLLVVPALITSSALGYFLMSFASPLAASSPHAQAWDKQPSALAMSVAGFVGWWSCAVYMFWASVGTLLARLHSAALAS